MKMMNIKKAKTMVAMMVLTWFAINPAAAQNVRDQTGKPLVGIYIVINTGFSKSRLDDIHNMLESWNIDAGFEDTRYAENRLVHCKMKINIPHKFTGEYTTDISDSQPLIFYFETDKGNFLSDIPATLSSKSKAILSHNLIGVLILSDHGRMEAHGSFQTTWE
jgi:hypothetical protein